MDRRAGRADCGRRRPVPFNQVSDNLKGPANDEQRQSPAPVEEKERQRNYDEWNANAVCEFVQRMAVLGFVVLDERFGHRHLI